MFGSVKEVCAELFREYGSDEPITVLIWDAGAVRYFTEQWEPDEGEVLAILETMGCTDIEEYQRYGIGQQYIHDTMTQIAKSRGPTRKVEVSADELEIALHLAIEALDHCDLEAMDSDTARKLAAVEVLQAALHS
ncbi:hypothetical protein B194_5441 [Serratia plymuthica A30]|uniref:DUF1380 domain-containing protein n=1 Tax=Serratia plymuthica TaxID=82996 RepID=A0A318NU46_SERPL|nr:DUF1380 family protein [Serratia plymuthica]AGO57682.1 hypothetical protein SOD_p00080 [Serratia plymuthica 4Rx13]EKF67039.1 hypothetical protein B194_5441 [Serratia plymuthica A30]PYD36558.1 DUF1380 domain-containing protein [Serratia plymuthica]